jgi:membrane protein YdbS with pleckstrin-like domain
MGIMIGRGGEKTKPIEANCRLGSCFERRISCLSSKSLSDIYLMAVIDMQTKPCPFCAETIQAAAIKCRFCGEFLNTEKAKALEVNPGNDPDLSEEEEIDYEVLFAGRPSILGMAPAVIKALVVFVIAWLLIRLPLESFVSSLLDLKLTATQAFAISRYRVLAGEGIGALVILILLFKAVKLKTIYYEITPDRIEWSRGILDRRVDNVDMFRVVDLKMRRSLLDCVFGIGTVALVTNDKTDPEFVFEKVRDCRYLYDVIKKASLAADRKTGVVHID